MPNLPTQWSRWTRAAGAALLTVSASMVGSASARAQSLTVLPVNVQLAPGQMATTVTAVNHGESETSIQVRALVWSQVDGQERLAATDEIVVSPPITTVPAGGTQVIRVVLRHPAQAREGTYRLLIDQIPPVATPGTVRIVLRLSIPVFAQIETRATPHVRYTVETSGQQASLVLSNEGNRHEKLTQVSLQGSGGRSLSIAAEPSPYVLAGAINRWRLAVPPGLLVPGASVRLTAQSDSGAVDQSVSVVAAR